MAFLADEPVSAVDPARARDVLDLLVRLCEEEGLTLLVSMHQLELAQDYFPRVVGLKAGRIVFDGEGSSLREEEVADLFQLRERTAGE